MPTTNLTMTPKFDSLSNLTEENTKQLLNILESNVDVTSCLVNCSNNGICKLDSTTTLKYICECKEHFIGTQCQTDQRPCSRSTNKCMNNGTCINSLNYTTFTCKCKENGLYFGQYCENTKDLCKNRTCSLHGYCKQTQNGSFIQTQCKCNKGYEGDDCEIESIFLKIVRNIQWLTTVLFVVAILIVCIFVITCDILDFYEIGSEHIDMDEWRHEKLHGVKQRKDGKVTKRFKFRRNLKTKVGQVKKIKFKYMPSLTQNVETISSQ